MTEAVYLRNATPVLALNALISRYPFLEGSGSSTSVLQPSIPRHTYLVMFEDTLHYHTRGKECYWHLVVSYLTHYVYGFIYKNIVCPRCLFFSFSPN